MRTVVPGIHRLDLGGVSAYLVEDGDGIAIVDTGRPGNADNILEALTTLGRTPDDVTALLPTHCHADHAGSLGALQAATNAPTYMHAADAAFVREGKAWRPWHPAPGPMNAIIFRMIDRTSHSIDPARVDHEVEDGEELDVCGGVVAVHVPGHCAGMVAWLLPRRGVLFVADAAAHIGPLALSPNYEDLELGRASLRKLAALDFETACFAHGRPIVSAASARFRRKWGSAG